jgi:hypothetical protein
MMQISAGERKVGVMAVEMLRDEGPATAGTEDEEETGGQEDETEDDKGRSGIVEGCGRKRGREADRGEDQLSESI